MAARIGQHDLHRRDVGRVEPRADQVLRLGGVAGGDVLRRAELAEHLRRQFVVGGHTAQERLFLDRVGEQRPQLRLHVRPQAVGQVLADFVRVAIDEVHHVSLFRQPIELADHARERAPLGRQFLRQLLALHARLVIAPGPAVLDAPRALEQSLRFEPAEQGIEGALVYLEALVREQLLEGVAVLLVPQLDEDRQHQGAPAEFEGEAVAGRLLCFTHYHVAHYTI